MKLDFRTIIFLTILFLSEFPLTSSLSLSAALEKLNADDGIKNDFILLRRKLNSNDENENNVNNDDDGNDDGWTSYLDFGFFWDALDRVDGDMQEMWQTSPNAWTTEDWEVFGGMMLVTLLALSCFCCLCCAPIFLFEDRDQKKVMTNENYAELQAANNSKNRQLDSASAPADDKAAAKGDDGKSAVSSLSAPSYKHRSALKKPILEEDPGLSVTGTYSTGTDPSSTRKKRKRRSLWSEVASVWGEFLADIGSGKNTFSKKYYVDDDDSDYKKLQRGRSRGYDAPFQRKSRKPKEITTKGEIV
mmetsp:Transcript_5427/g.8318  ORF Transcript_5427/g.8318 Transcript_5427/m.8318 type:complete len:303 (-) Transcript_5427:1450-2358(-)